MCGPPSLERWPEGRGSSSKSPEWRDGSQDGGAAPLVILERPLGQGAELAFPRIGFDLLIPGFGVEAREPIPECLQLLGAERLQLSLDLFNPAPSNLCSQLTPGARAGGRLAWIDP